MPYKWRFYLDLAERICSDYDDEQTFRCAISRAYYGAFCTCRNLKGLTTTGRGSHWDVINAYKDSDYGDEPTIGTILEGMKKRREHADYQRLPHIEKKDAETAIQDGKMIFCLLSNTYPDDFEEEEEMYSCLDMLGL